MQLALKETPYKSWHVGGRGRSAHGLVDSEFWGGSAESEGTPQNQSLLVHSSHNKTTSVVHPPTNQPINHLGPHNHPKLTAWTHTTHSIYIPYQQIICNMKYNRNLHTQPGHRTFLSFSSQKLFVFHLLNGIALPRQKQRKHGKAPQFSLIPTCVF